MTVPLYSLTDAWNNAGTTFTAIQMNVTDTASQAASLLLDLQVGGASKFKVGKDASLTLDSFLTVNSTGALCIGYTGVIQGTNGQSLVDIVGTGNDTTSLGIARFSSDLAGPFLTFTKSGNSTKGNQGLVDASATIGSISFEGSDGTNFLGVASIVGRMDALTPGANDMPGRLVFSTTSDGASSPAERLRIDSSGRLIKGGTSAQTFHGVLPAVQILGGGDDASYVQCRYSNDAFGSGLSLAKSRSTSAGAFSLVSNNDSLGVISWVADNGANMVNQPTKIESEIDGATSASSLPTRLRFSTTPSGSTTAAERMRIDSFGLVNIGNQGANTLTLFGQGILQTSATPSQQWANLACHRYTNDNGAPYITFVKSRGTTVGSVTTVNNGDDIGFIGFGATDGTQLVWSAYISGQVDDTIAANVVPTMLRFGTQSAAAPPVERLRLSSKGNIVCGLGNGALATNATDGFIYIPTCAGVPTGVPTTYTGLAAVIIDSTDNRLYFYSSGAWRNAGP